LIDMAYGVNVKLLLTHRLEHPLLEHQRGDVGEGDNGALLTGQPTSFAKPEETFDLFVYATHSLHFAELVDRAGDREALLERRARDGRNQRAAFAERSAVAVDVTIGLFQGDACRDFQRKLLGVTAAQIAGQDHD